MARGKNILGNGLRPRAAILPLTRQSLVELAEAGESLVGILELTTQEIIEACREAGSLEALRAAINETLVGLDFIIMPKKHLFESTLMKFNLTKKQHERSSYRVRKFRKKMRASEYSALTIPAQEPMDVKKIFGEDDD